MTSHRDLSVEMCGVTFPNPFMLSSSPVSNTAEMIGRAFDHGFGGTVYKTIVDDKTKIIHPSPRMASYDVGTRRIVGVQNVEQTTDRSLADNLADIRYLKKNWPRHVLIVSIMGFSEDEWVMLARASEDAGADMVELNFSCPHMTVEGSGMKVGQAMELVERFTAAARRAIQVPILAKLTSNVTDITVPARYAKNGGADGITAINTVRALTEVGLDDLVPRPNVFGRGAMSGYSGPAIKPIGLKCVTELAKCAELGLPISGCGGVETWVDAVEYLACGASTVQMTTGVIHYGQRIVESLNEGLADYLDLKGLASVGQLVGAALPNVHPTDAFDLTRQGVADYDLTRCVGCGQCFIVCQDAGGQNLRWDDRKRRPILNDEGCLSCMVCSFVCPVDGLITYREVKDKKAVVPPVSV